MMFKALDRRCADCGHEFRAIKPACQQCDRGYGLAGDVDPRLLDSLHAFKGKGGVSDWVGEQVDLSLVHVVNAAGIRQAVFELFWLLRESWQRPSANREPFPYSVFAAVGLLDDDSEGVSICARCWEDGGEPVRVWDGHTRQGMRQKRQTLSELARLLEQGH